jgi:hypothetical protein
MNDFLGTLAARSLGSTPSIRPRAVSLFEPETAQWEGSAGGEIVAETVNAEADVPSPPSVPAEPSLAAFPETAGKLRRPPDGAPSPARIEPVPVRLERTGGRGEENIESEPPAAPIPIHETWKTGAPAPPVPPSEAVDSESVPEDAGEIRRTSVGGRIEIRVKPEPAEPAAGPASAPSPSTRHPVPLGAELPAAGVPSGERPLSAVRGANETAGPTRSPPAETLKSGLRAEAPIPRDSEPRREETAPISGRAFDPGGGERPPADAPGPAEPPEVAGHIRPAGAMEPGPYRISERTDTMPDMRPYAAPESAPTIRVTIGRIEVRAVAPPETRRPPADTSAERSRVMSLDEYLKQRTGK